MGEVAVRLLRSLPIAAKISDAEIRAEMIFRNTEGAILAAERIVGVAEGRIKGDLDRLREQLDDRCRVVMSESSLAFEALADAADPDRQAFHF